MASGIRFLTEVMTYSSRDTTNRLAHTQLEARDLGMEVVWKFEKRKGFEQVGLGCMLIVDVHVPVMCAVSVVPASHVPDVPCSRRASISERCCDPLHVNFES